MGRKRTETDGVRDIVREQTRILSEMRGTKAYRAIEGYHFLKTQKGAHKIRETGKVLKHVSGKPDKKIQVQDPMDAVLSLQEEMERELDLLDDKLRRYQEYLQIFPRIQDAKKNGRGVICIFAPYQIINLPDGYSRRVKNVDDLLGEQMLRIYISQDPGIKDSVPVCSFEKENYISVIYNILNDEHCTYISAITRLVEIAYIHSVYQAISAVIQDPGVTKLYDFHGVVPEELLLMEREKEADYYNEKEMELVQNAEYIIVANQAMKDHIVRKYPGCAAQFILMPMNNEDNNLDGVICETSNEESRLQGSGQKPVVIYSGGLQKWQLIPEMQDAISMEREQCEFHIYVSDPNAFMLQWGGREAPEKWEVTTKTAEEMKEAYKNAQYGFILRDDIVVNHVACPTKMIDYIKYDIIIMIII